MATIAAHSIKSSEIRSRIEPDIKEDAARVLARCGLNLSDAIRLFLRQVVINNGLPFAVKVPNATTRAAMEEANGDALPHFKSAEELFDDLDKAAKNKAR